MLKMLWYLLLVIASVWLGVLISKDPGYVLIAVQHWTVEMPLWLAAIGVLLAFIVLSMIWGIIKTVTSLGDTIRDLFVSRKRHRSHTHTLLALHAYLETRWSEAESQFLKGAVGSEHPAVQFLFAARAANKQRAADRRDDYLQRASALPEFQLALTLQQANYAMLDGKWETAIDILKQSGSIDPYDRLVLRILTVCYEKLADWHALVGLLPAIRNLGTLPTDEYQALSIKVYQGLLLKCAASNELSSVIELWNHIPKVMRREPMLITTYVTELNRLGANDAAVELAQQTLKKQWFSSLASQFGKMKNPRPEKALAMMETWLQEFPNDPTLLNALGQLAQQAKLWGKARSFLETSFQTRPSRETAVKLAKLYESTGDMIAAQSYYQQAAELEYTLAPA